MKNFKEALRERVERLDADALNRVRMIAVLFSVLVFGMFLSDRIFLHAVALPSAQLTAIAAEPNMDTIVPIPLPAVAEIASSTPSEPLLTILPSVPLLEATSSGPATFLEPFSISAKEAIMTSGPTLRNIVYQKNADEKTPPASLTKLMTAVIVSSYAPPEDTLTVTRSAADTEGPTGGLVAGETLTVGDTLKIMLIVSSNGAAVALSDYFTSKGLDLVELMNEKARALGMLNTHFANPDGLDDNAHYSSARDLAALTAYSLGYQNIWDILSLKSAVVVSEDGRVTHRLVSTNQLVEQDVAHVKAGKTGYTPKAGGCMISLLDDGSIVVVLGSEQREKDSEKLIIETQRL